MLRLLLFKLRPLLDIQAEVDPAQEHRDEQLHGEEDHDSDLARYVSGGVFGLEDLRPNDVADTECGQCQRVDSILGNKRSDGQRS